MICIYCGSKTRVMNSRLQKRHNNIWRRRECGNCMAVFTTSESPDFFKGWVVESSNDVQPFSRDKLFASVHDGLKHRKTAITDATHLTDTIIGRLYSLLSSGSLNKSDIIVATMDILKNFDKVSYTQYQAYHPLDK